MDSQIEKALREPRYSVAETARFVGMGSARVGRWLRGYRYEWIADGRRRKGHQGPIVKKADEYPSGTSFIDLIELLFVKKFVDKGFSLQKIRAAMEEAQEILDLDYPFASGKFFTDGREIYLQFEKDKPKHLLQLFSRGQWVISEVIRAMADQITFDNESDLPLEWAPLGKEQGVVMNPLVSFGAPSLSTRHVKTSNVYDLYIGEGRDLDAVAAWFSVSANDIRAAVRFEESLLAA